MIKIIFKVFKTFPSFVLLFFVLSLGISRFFAPAETLSGPEVSSMMVGATATPMSVLASAIAGVSLLVALLFYHSFGQVARAEVAVPGLVRFCLGTIAEAVQLSVMGVCFVARQFRRGATWTLIGFIKWTNYLLVHVGEPMLTVVLVLLHYCIVAAGVLSGLLMVCVIFVAFELLYGAFCCVRWTTRIVTKVVRWLAFFATQLTVRVVSFVACQFRRGATCCLDWTTRTLTDCVEWTVYGLVQAGGAVAVAVPGLVHFYGWTLEGASLLLVKGLSLVGRQFRRGATCWLDPTLIHSIFWPVFVLWLLCFVTLCFMIMAGYKFGLEGGDFPGGVALVRALWRVFLVSNHCLIVLGLPILFPSLPAYAGDVVQSLHELVDFKALAVTVTEATGSRLLMKGLSTFATQLLRGATSCSDMTRPLIKYFLWTVYRLPRVGGTVAVAVLGMVHFCVPSLVLAGQLLMKGLSSVAPRLLCGAMCCLDWSTRALIDFFNWTAYLLLRVGGAVAIGVHGLVRFCLGTIAEAVQLSVMGVCFVARQFRRGATWTLIGFIKWTNYLLVHVGEPMLTVVLVLLHYCIVAAGVLSGLLMVCVIFVAFELLYGAFCCVRWTTRIVTKVVRWLAFFATQLTVRVVSFVACQFRRPGVTGCFGQPVPFLEKTLFSMTLLWFLSFGGMLFFATATTNGKLDAGLVWVEDVSSSCLGVVLSVVLCAHAVVAAWKLGLFCGWIATGASDRAVKGLKFVAAGIVGLAYIFTLLGSHAGVGVYEMVCFRARSLAERVTLVSVNGVPPDFADEDNDDTSTVGHFSNEEESDSGFVSIVDFSEMLATVEEGNEDIEEDVSASTGVWLSVAPIAVLGALPLAFNAFFNVLMPFCGRTLEGAILAARKGVSLVGLRFRHGVTGCFGQPVPFLEKTLFSMTLLWFLSFGGMLFFATATTNGKLDAGLVWVEDVSSSCLGVVLSVVLCAHAVVAAWKLGLFCGWIATGASDRAVKGLKFVAAGIVGLAYIFTLLGSHAGVGVYEMVCFRARSLAERVTLVSVNGVPPDFADEDNDDTSTVGHFSNEEESDSGFVSIVDFSEMLATVEEGNEDIEEDVSASTGVWLSVAPIAVLGALPLAFNAFFNVLMPFCGRTLEGAILAARKGVSLVGLRFRHGVTGCFGQPVPFLEKTLFSMTLLWFLSFGGMLFFATATTNGKLDAGLVWVEDVSSSCLGVVLSVVLCAHAVVAAWKLGLFCGWIATGASDRAVKGLKFVAAGIVGLAYIFTLLGSHAGVGVYEMVCFRARSLAERVTLVSVNGVPPDFADEDNDDTSAVGHFSNEEESDSGFLSPCDDLMEVDWSKDTEEDDSGCESSVAGPLNGEFIVSIVDFSEMLATVEEGNEEEDAEEDVEPEREIFSIPAVLLPFPQMEREPTDTESLFTDWDEDVGLVDDEVQQEVAIVEAVLLKACRTKTTKAKTFGSCLRTRPYLKRKCKESVRMRPFLMRKCKDNVRYTK